MAPQTNEVCDNGGGDPPSKVAADGPPPPPPPSSPPPPVAAVVAEGADDKNKSPRHPRWTRQETFTLIEGKKVAENRGKRGRRSGSGSVFGSGQIEPKWDSVASYCKQHGVNRGPVQCRKRWSNMVGDFKKIKAWESQVKEEIESYWELKNDLRKENKLPGFFDREVFDVLNGKAVTKEAYQLALVTVSANAKEDEKEVELEEDEAEVVFDSGQRATSDGLFPEFDRMEEETNGQSSEKDKTGVSSHDSPTKEIHNPMPISEKRYQPFHQAYCQGTLKEQQANSSSWKGCMSQEGCKRRKVLINECQDTNLDARLLEVLEKNTSMWNAQIEVQNTNCQLDREQRKEYNDSLVSALNNITNALTKIADKL